MERTAGGRGEGRVTSGDLGGRIVVKGDVDGEVVEEEAGEGVDEGGERREKGVVFVELFGWLSGGGGRESKDGGGGGDGADVQSTHALEEEDVG